MQELTQITRRLADGGVEFVVAGGLGVILQGSALMTRDVDVVCRMSSENLLRLFESIAPLHPVHRMSAGRMPFTKEQASRSDWKNFYFSTDWGQLDCLGEVRGIGGYEECLALSEPIDVGMLTIRVLTLEALITAKRAMGRPRDLHAVLELEAILERRSHP